MCCQEFLKRMFSLWSPACAEGSVLSLFSFDKFKAEKKRKKIPAIKPLRLVKIRILSSGPDKQKSCSLHYWTKYTIIGVVVKGKIISRTVTMFATKLTQWIPPGEVSIQNRISTLKML